jgi:hypothetical protein
MSPRLALLRTSGSAFGFSLFQTVHRWMDEDKISGVSVAAILVVALLYVWWSRCLQEAGRGEGSPLPGLLVLAAAWSFAALGVGALAECRPTCHRSELFTPIGNTAFGAAAVGASWWAIRRHPSPVPARAGLISAGLVAASLTLQALT